MRGTTCQVIDSFILMSLENHCTIFCFFHEDRKNPICMLENRIEQGKMKDKLIVRVILRKVKKRFF